MASLPAKTHLSLIVFLSFALLIHAGLNLHRSDSNALLLFKKHVGFNGQLHSPENLCNSDGIFCARRISDNSPVLRVIRIVLDSKGLNGTLSPVIGRFSELKELSLPNNQLVDRIPSEIVDCRKLQILNLQNNRFSGKIPSEFSSLVNLRVLDLSSNRFSGDLSFLKYFPNLENLSLSDNFFSGKIPKSIRSFRNLRFLNLSGNNYLEQSSIQTSMRRVEYSLNDLRTKNVLPKRYIFAENSTRNHSSAAMAPYANPAFDSNSSNSGPAPSVTIPKHHKKKKNVRGWIIVGMISGVILSLLFKLVMICIKRREKESCPKESCPMKIFSPLIKKAEDLAFLEKEDALASSEIIGRGRCGVYKAELPGSNGKMIAIKKIIHPEINSADLSEEDSRLLSRKMQNIKSEINTAGQIRHRNLLPLLAYVPRPNCHYLVYEYMKNGSLQDMLKQVSDGTRELDWIVRHRIALGVAAGLEYLHISHSPRIIHRDLTPANILLDDDMEPRIANFGLATAVPDADTWNVVGTVGYIAPEYLQGLMLTDKCDIYSFGVLLAVLVTGKLPDEFLRHTYYEMSLVEWLRDVMTSEDPNRAIDSKLRGNGYESQMLLVLKIACFCTMDDPKQRPDSKDVRCMLDQVKH